MKILQINKFFFLKGGAERHFFDLSELLSMKGHQVSIWSTKHPLNFPFPNQKDFAKFIDFSKKDYFLKEIKKLKNIFWNKEAKKKLEKIIKYKKPDIAHLHNIFSHFSSSIIYILKKYNIPIILTLHDYKLFCPNYKFFSNNNICFDCLKNKNYKSCIYKKCIKDSYIKSFAGYLEGKWNKDFLKVAEKIDIFLAPSLFIKKKAIEWGIPKEKIIHLPNFIDENYISKKTKSKKQSNYFLYFGRLSKEKGVEFLIKSFLNISNDFPEWKLKIAGDGPEERKLKKAFQKNKQIEFLGRKNNKELNKIISKAYLIVVPSLWPENFPYSILESNILAIPVLASRTGGLTKLIKHEKTGLLFKLGDHDDLENKIIWSIRNPKKIKQIGELTQKEVFDKYNSEKYYEKIMKIYKNI